MTSQEESLIRSNGETLCVFLGSYLTNYGIQLHLRCAAAKELYGHVASIDDAIALVREALSINRQGQVAGLNLGKLVEAAPALALVVRYAQFVHAIPANVIPSDQVVDAAMKLLHASLR